MLSLPTSARSSVTSFRNGRSSTYNMATVIDNATIAVTSSSVNSENRMTLRLIGLSSLTIISAHDASNQHGAI